MGAPPLDRTAVEEVLDLLSAIPVVTAVTLYDQDIHVAAQITVRKMAPQQGRHTQYRYGWEARATAGEQAWAWAGAQVYTTAEAAYQAAVQAVQAALSGPMAEQAPADGK